MNMDGAQEHEHSDSEDCFCGQGACVVWHVSEEESMHFCKDCLLWLMPRMLANVPDISQLVNQNRMEQLLLEFANQYWMAVFHRLARNRPRPPNWEPSPN